MRKALFLFLIVWGISATSGCIDPAGRQMHGNVTSVRVAGTGPTSCGVTVKSEASVYLILYTFSEVGDTPIQKCSLLREGDPVTILVCNPGRYILQEVYPYCGTL